MPSWTVHTCMDTRNFTNMLGTTQTSIRAGEFPCMLWMINLIRNQQAKMCIWPRWDPEMERSVNSWPHIPDILWCQNGWVQMYTEPVKFKVQSHMMPALPDSDMELCMRLLRMPRMKMTQEMITSCKVFYAVPNAKCHITHITELLCTV